MFLSRQRSLVLFVLSLLATLLLAAACSKAEKEATTPASSSAPATAGAAPVAAPAPAAPAPASAAPTAAPAPAPVAPPVATPSAPSTTAVRRRPIPGPGGLVAVFPQPLDRMAPGPGQDTDPRIQILLKYNADKLPLWTKASYGGESRLSDTRISPGLFDPFGLAHITRTGYGEPLIRMDMGRCTLQGKTDMSTCDGTRAEVYAAVLVGGVFQRWEQPDPLTYLFHIDPRLVWPAIPPMNRADRKVTAEDAAWYMQTQKKEGILRDGYSLTNTIEALDANTVKVTMKAPHADFIRMMSSGSMVLTPPECWPIKVCVDRNVLISPGPFIWKDFQFRVRSLFVKNEEFHLKGAPWIDSIVVLNITDPVALKAAFTTGQIDASSTTFEDLERLQKAVPGVLVQAWSSPYGQNAYRLQLKGPLADVRVRRALVQGVDWPVFLATVGAPDFIAMSISYEYLGLTMPVSYSDASPYHKFNPEAARKLLVDAGYADGFTVTIETSSASGSLADANLALRNQWKRNLNVEVKVKLGDLASQISALYESKWEGMWQNVCWITYCASIDADSYMLQEVSWSAQNFNKVNDPVIDAIFQKQRGELDPAKRTELLWQYQRYTWEQFYSIMLFGFWSFSVFQPWDMNQAAHTYISGGFSGAMWTTMFDLSKQPKR